MFTYRGLYKGFQSNSTLVASYCFVNKTSLCLCQLASIVSHTMLEMCILNRLLQEASPYYQFK